MKNKDFAKKLKEYRQELSIKRGQKVGQEQLAKELKVSKSIIGDIERGARYPSKSILTKLAKHSGKSLDFWMDGLEKYQAPNTVDLVLDRLIELNVITDINNINDEIWDTIKKAVMLEIERKLNV
jgi:transcriptional regulator with XRE-family HTH domain